MRNRSVGMMILLSVITLGIYFIYWSVVFQSELKEKTGEGFGGLGHFLMLFVPFYSLYWAYAAGKRIAKVGGDDDSLLYLLLSLFGFFIIVPFLMQSKANNLA